MADGRQGSALAGSAGRSGEPDELAVAAAAKVNLALHVTGQRADGYHLLDSLVAFATPLEGATPADGDAPMDGDLLTVAFGHGDAAPRLELDGPFAAEVPPGADNIVVRAAAAVGGISSVRLWKGLPVAAGIGGGSADAAAVLRAAAMHRGLPVAHYAELALALGADVPVCLVGRPSLMRGIGEAVTPVALPPVAAVLVNPRVPVATRDVFAALSRKDNAPMRELVPFAGPADLADWLAATRNDLEAPAVTLAPVIAEVLGALRAMEGCRLARMSGSGRRRSACSPTLRRRGARPFASPGAAGGGCGPRRFRRRRGHRSHIRPRADGACVSPSVRRRCRRRR